MTRNHRLAAVLLGLTACSGAFAGSVMEPGGWEMTMTVTGYGPAPGEKKSLGESTTKACLSQAFLDKDPYLTPGVDQEKAAKRGATCSVSDEKRSATAASWKMTCVLKDGTSSDTQISNTAGAKEMRSEVSQTLVREGKTVQMKVITTARHIGECTEDMRPL